MKRVLFIAALGFITIVAIAQSTSSIKADIDNEVTNKSDEESITADGLGNLLKRMVDFVASYVGVADARKHSFGGDATSAVDTFGTTSNQGLAFMTNGIIRGTVGSGGGWVFGNSNLSSEYAAIFDNSGTAQIRAVLGLGAALSNGSCGFIFDGAGTLTNYSVISGEGNNLSIGADVFYLGSRTSGTTSPVISGGGATSTSFGDILRITLRSAYAGSSFSPTSGTTSMITWQTNGSGTNYIPSSGSHRFIGVNFAPTIAATSTWSGALEGFTFNPTVTSVASGTVKGFRATNNSGYAFIGEGTAPSSFGGTVMVGTTTNDLFHKLIVNGATKTTSLTISGVLEYADNAAALGGGLTAGMVYRTGDNLKIVH